MRKLLEWTLGFVGIIISMLAFTVEVFPLNLLIFFVGGLILFWILLGEDRTVKKWIEETLLWVISLAVTFALFNAVFGEFNNEVLFWVAVAGWAIMLETLIKKVFLYPLTIGICYLVCGVVLLSLEVRRSIIIQRDMKKKRDQLRREDYVWKEAHRRANLPEN